MNFSSAMLRNRILSEVIVYVAESNNCNLHTKDVVEDLKKVFKKVYTWDDVKEHHNYDDYPDGAEFCIIIPPVVKRNRRDRLGNSKDTIIVGKGIYTAYLAYGNGHVLESYNGSNSYTLAEVVDQYRANNSSWKEYASLTIDEAFQFTIPDNDSTDIKDEVPKFPTIISKEDSTPYNPLHLLLLSRKRQ